MSDTIISVERLSKRYKLGQIGATSLRESAERLWHRLRGRDPDEHMGKVGAERRERVAELPSCQVARLPKGNSVAELPSCQVAKLPKDTSSLNSTTQQPDNLTTDPNSTTQQPDNPTTDPRDLWALRDVSFTVRRGEVLGIIGRNGAGKSTLLKILTRITEPTSGRAIMRGRVASLLEVGTGFHPELTGRENIFLNGAILGMRKAEIARKFDEIVAFSEVERFIDTPVKRYSSGMYVRLAFAVAAHLDPEILLIDEVLAVGDSAFQKKCVGKMGEVAREGRTVLLVSHNMPMIVNLCSRAIVLRAGMAVQDAPPSQAVESYLTSSRSGQGDGAGEVAWPDLTTAPGNDIVRLQSVRILQDGIDGPTADVDMSQEIVIEVTYRCMKEGARLFTSVWLKTGLDVFVLSSSNTPSITLTKDSWYGCPHPLGSFRSLCRIPRDFLNEGRYTIAAISALVPSTNLALAENCVFFDVHDTGEMRKGGYYGPWIGPVIRPKLSWSTVLLGS